MNSKIFKSPILRTSLFVALISGMVSCGNEIKTNDDTKAVAEKANDAKFDSSQNERDAQFLVNASEISLENIKLGQLAQQKSALADIKTLGKKMEEYHTKALSDLRGLAQSKTISLPESATKDAMDHFDKMKDMKGDDFDRMYSNMMVESNKDAIGMFEKASADVNDPQIKQWASSMMTGFRENLDQAMTCQNMMAKKK